jgi:N-alpha-acetyl-L-2,4-diaminobutyrate deacetylase
VAAGQPLGQVHFVQYPQQAPMVVTVQRAGILIGRRAPGFVEVGDTVAVIARAVLG